MKQEEYIRLSLELHLFFDRIMKEHSFFLEAAFQEKDQEFKKIAHQFQEAFSNILERSIQLANNNLNEEFLMTEEIVTQNTLLAERQSEEASGININNNITIQELNLKSETLNCTEELLYNIEMLNKQTIPTVQNLIQFKQETLNKVLSCKMFTNNYPLLITHIMNEAKMYHNLLTKIEKKEPFAENYIYEQEIFWNTIMKEHAEFIRGLLDPTERALIIKADEFADNYENILNSYKNNLDYLTNTSLQQTINFKKFKIAGEEGILNCKIKSIIVPLLADHVLREANHFIRILQSPISHKRS